MSAETPRTTESASTPKPDIYSRIIRFAPAFVVLFCVLILVTVAIVRPFESPEPALSTNTQLVGANNDPTGVYFIIHNAGGSDTLIGASSPVASSAVLQIIDPTTTTTLADVAPRTQTYITVDRIDVPGFDDLRFVPGGNQVLLSDLSTPLTVGQTIPVTLRFERAGDVTMQAEVQPYPVIADRLLPPRLKLAGE